MAVLAVALVVKARSSQRHRENYMFEGDYLLEHHEARVPRVDDKVVVFLLGSSTVAGSYIPWHTTISDFWNKLQEHVHSYNLASFGSSVLDSLLIFSVVEEAHPRVAVLGIDPTSFASRFNSGWVQLYRDRLKECNAPALEEAAAQDSRFRIVGFALQADFLPPKGLSRIWTQIDALHDRLYGPVHSKTLYGQERPTLGVTLSPEYPLEEIFTCFARMARNRKSEPVVVYQPIFKTAEVYAPGDFSAYQKRINAIAKAHDIRVLDYTNIVPDDASHFIDYMHLTPRGNKLVAERLNSDLKDML